MVDKEGSRLLRMGLTKLTKDDTFLEHEEEWDEREFLYEALRGSRLVDKKPAGNFFEIAAPTDDKVYVSCHLTVPILSIKAQAWQNNMDGTPVKLELEAEYDWAMEEAAEWSKEYLKFDEVSHKDKYSPFRLASDPETYSVPNYYEYIPADVRNAEEKYKTKFLEANYEDNDWLNLGNIKVTYMTLKCNLPLINDQKIQHHYKKVHLLPNGALSLNKRETIKVNKDLDFKITDLTKFQDVSQNEQNALINKIYTHVVAVGVFEESSGRNEARINKSRSTEFINEMKKVCLQNYFERFKFSLKSIIKEVYPMILCAHGRISKKPCSKRLETKIK